MPERDAAAERVYEELRRRIVRWELPPGSAMREVELAAELDVSRTPIREALQRLKSNGLVVARGRRGVEVPAWDTAHLEEAYRMRADLEAWSAKRAAERLSTTEIGRLRVLADDMSRMAAEPEPDLEAIAAANVSFHEQVRQGASSERLLQMTNHVVHLPLLHRVFHLFTPNETATTLTEHHTMLRAFEARDPDWAESITRAHILAALHTLLRNVDDPERGEATAQALGRSLPEADSSEDVVGR